MKHSWVKMGNPEKSESSGIYRLNWVCCRCGGKGFSGGYKEQLENATEPYLTLTVDADCDVEILSKVMQE